MNFFATDWFQGSDNHVLIVPTVLATRSTRSELSIALQGVGSTYCDRSRTMKCSGQSLRDRQIDLGRSAPS